MVKVIAWHPMGYIVLKEKTNIWLSYRDRNKIDVMSWYKLEFIKHLESLGFNKVDVEIYSRKDLENYLESLTFIEHDDNDKTFEKTTPYMNKKQLTKILKDISQGIENSNLDNCFF